MNIRLAYRIATMPILASTGTGTEHVVDMVKFSVLKSERIVLDNVAEFYASHNQVEWCLEKDIPNWSPPFREFFAEWNWPELWTVKEGIVRRKASQVGILVHAHDMSDGFDYPWLGDSDEADEFRQSAKKAKWVLECMLTGVSSDKKTSGLPFVADWLALISVDQSGRYIKRIVGSPSLNADEMLATDTYLHVLGLGISFMHCKNVEKDARPVENKPRWHHQTKCPIIKFRTLDIAPMRQVLRREGESETNGIKKALHICRGHFATYSEDKPLFGKYVGQFWRPSHTRGDIKAGAVVKDYSV